MKNDLLGQYFVKNIWFWKHLNEKCLVILILNLINILLKINYLYHILYGCFLWNSWQSLDLEKSFDKVNWNKMFLTLREIGVEQHDLKIIHNLYKNQTAYKKRRSHC